LEVKNALHKGSVIVTGMTGAPITHNLNPQGTKYLEKVERKYILQIPLALLSH